MSQHAIRTGDGQVAITNRIDGFTLVYVHEDGPKGGAAAEVTLDAQQRQALADALGGRDRAVAEAVSKLVVTMNDDDPGFVQVDAGAILPTKNHPRYWTYAYEGDSQWRHVDGGDVGTLMDLLHGLASYYVERAEAVQ